MTMNHLYLDIYQIELDPDNPRIAYDLRNVTDKLDEVNLEFALNPNDAKFNELRQAIMSNDGIINPIIVNHVNGKYKVIEGNTRLAIYRILNKEDPDDTRWKNISAFVHEDMSKEAIDAVRLQAHLIGIRNWTPFAKAKYLHYLWHEKKLSPSELVDFCGGDGIKVQRTINAYQEMMDNYKPLVNDDEFLTNKYSLFFESQNPKIRRSLQEHNYKIKDLAIWVAEGKFEPRQELVRKLPEILKNSRSREVFLKDGAAQAELYVERPQIADELAKASLLELCQAIDTVMDNMEVKQLKVVQEKVGQIEDAIKSMVAFYEEQLKQHSEMPLEIDVS